MRSNKIKISLGCGLISIGREWGYKKSDIPAEKEAIRFLQFAFKLGIRFFDTAPSYGASEQRFGKFLMTLSDLQKKKIIVATKFGEHWDEGKNEAYTDHSYSALIKSLNQSFARLGKIDILQVHKTTPAVLRSKDLFKALEYAKKKGVKKFGASVSDIESAEMVLNSNIFSVIQLPFNRFNTQFEQIIKKAKNKKKFIIINRPFAMGELIYKHNQEINKKTLLVNAYRFIKKLNFEGVILTGTKSPIHLKENFEAFNQA
jgi:aryl-alcohol dehydrogenase-like predicted oxidoreductase